MFRNLLTKRIATAVAVGAVLALTQLSAPGVVTTSPAIELTAACSYAARTTTSTDLTLDKSFVEAGESNSASVTVSSDAGTPQGTVTFRIPGHLNETVTLASGQASQALPTDLRAGRTYQVRARYNGDNTGPDCYRKSGDSTHFRVEGNGGGISGEEGSGGPGQPGTGAGVLGDTGAAENTELYGLLGLGLVGLGGLGLVINRRRARN